VRGAFLLVSALGLLGCATPDLPQVAGPAVRAAPEDGDLLAVVPAEAEVLVSFDVEALRTSPWTRPVVAAGVEAGKRARGFDEIADVDRLLLVRLPADTEGISLSISQGRFDRDRVRAAFGAGRKMASADYHGCTVWTAGGEAAALLTDRTLLSGALASVRAAIDAAYGRARDLRSETWLAQLRRRFGKDLRPAAIELAMRISDSMRARLSQEMVEAEGLERIGARLELGKRLDLAVVGATATPQQASALIERAESALRDLRSRPSLMALGFDRMLAGVQLAVQGPRVAAELRLAERDRDEIASRLSSVARLLAPARQPGGEKKGAP
jgi:hypothetical protein